MRWTTFVLGVLVASAALGAEGRDAAPRLRFTSELGPPLLAAGLARSSTMRALVEEIEQSDVIVYVNVIRRLPNALAGRLRFIGHAGRYRMVAVDVSVRLNEPRRLATLGHELQHVLEVVREPSVRSEGELRRLYARIGIGRSASQVFDTVAALRVGERVLDEVMAASAAAAGGAGGLGAQFDSC